MSTKYALNFANHSTNNASIVLYQRDPSPSPGEYSLAWFAHPTPQEAKVVIQWFEDYSFVQGATGQLEPGVIFQATQIIDADPAGSNAVELSYENAAARFTDQRAGATPGTLVIQNSGSVPMGQLAEGIGMSGSPTFVVQAQPNMTVSFQPRPEYWIAFGTFEQGQVLDSNLMFGGKAMGATQIYGPPTPVQYPAGVYAMTATLDKNNSWALEPSS